MNTQNSMNVLKSRWNRKKNKMNEKEKNKQM